MRATVAARTAASCAARVAWSGLGGRFVEPCVPIRSVCPGSVPQRSRRLLGALQVGDEQVVRAVIGRLIAEQQLAPVDRVGARLVVAPGHGQAEQLLEQPDVVALLRRIGQLQNSHADPPLAPSNGAAAFEPSSVRRSLGDSRVG
jgi:hypothetical protein